MTSRLDESIGQSEPSPQAVIRLSCATRTRTGTMVPFAEDPVVDDCILVELKVRMPARISTSYLQRPAHLS